MKPIAIAFSDLHVNLWKKHSIKGSRTILIWGILKKIAKRAQKLGIPVLHSGDLFHNPKSIENGLLRDFIFTYSDTFEKYGVNFYSISGNHDMSEKNTPEYKSPSYIDSFDKVFPTFKSLDFSSDWLGPQVKVHGIPYINGNVGFNKEVKHIIKSLIPNTFNILMIHTDLPQATDAFGHEIKEVQNINIKLFQAFDLVINGHIHKPQKLYKNAYILGSPYQQTRSEKGTELGYWLIYANHKPKFVPLNLPKFIDIEEGKEIPDDGNFYTIIPKPRETFISGKKYDAKIDRIKLAKKYIKHTEVKEFEKAKALIKILNSIP